MNIKLKRMHIKRVMIVGTMIVAMSFGGTAWGKPSLHTLPVAKWSTTDLAHNDELLNALNLSQSSGEELYDALYDGKSLHTIAAENGGDINNVINLQVKQLTRQLDARLAGGSITQQQYTAQKAELREIVSQSVMTSLG